MTVRLPTVATPGDEVDHPLSPAALPASLLANPRVVDALAQRDVGAVFALAHELAGTSFNKLAEACGIRAERVSKMARGTGTHTSLPVLERVCDGLRIPGAHFGLAERPWENNPSRTDARPEMPHGDDPMKRREVLRGALAAGLTGAGLAALTDTRHTLDAALADHATADLGYWEGTAERFGYGYHGQAPTAVLADLAVDFAEMKPLFSAPQTVSSRARLCHVAGQMAGMTAIVLHDLGDRREAHAWFHTAGRAAEESGDNHLNSWVLAREAMVPLNFGAPQGAADLAERARHLAGDLPSSSAALAAAVSARAHALQGNRQAALDALDDVEQLMDRLDPSQQVDTWFGYPEQKHHVHLSQALTLLGETDRAYATQARALELSRSPSLMTRALIAIDRATCLLHDGHADESARTAAQAYGQLPASYRTGLTRTRATALYRALPRQVSAAEDLREALAL